MFFIMVQNKSTGAISFNGPYESNDTAHDIASTVQDHHNVSWWIVEMNRGPVVYQGLVGNNS